jgi:hypothetical protein
MVATEPSFYAPVERLTEPLPRTAVPAVRKFPIPMQKIGLLKILKYHLPLLKTHYLNYHSLS